MQELLSDYSTPKAYQQTVNKLRAFFATRNYKEIDPHQYATTLLESHTAHYAPGKPGTVSQAHELSLEKALLQSPELLPGVFCLTDQSCEFAARKDTNTAQTIGQALCQWLQLGDRSVHKESDYRFIADYYKTKFLSPAHEQAIWQDFSPIFTITDKPCVLNTCFTTLTQEAHAKTTDTVLFGMSSVTSARRSCDPEDMREAFYTVSNGEYAKSLFELFGESRVMGGLEKFLVHNFFPRYGGSIGIPQLMQAIHLAKNERYPSIVRVTTAPSQMIGR